MKKFICNVCLVVSGTIGVGFLSGKELRIFVGSLRNIAVFVVVFTAAQIVYSLWASKYRSADVQTLCAKTFGKCATVIYFLLVLGNVATVVALLATADETLCAITDLGLRLPIFALVVCLLSSVVGRSDNAVSILSAVAVTCAVVYIALPLVVANGRVQFEQCDVSIFQTAVYALFSATALCGVTTRIACNHSVRQNVLIAVTSSATLGVLMWVRMTYAVATTTASVFATIFVATTYLSSATTSVYANSVAPLSLLDEVTHDRTMSSCLLFALCLSLCLLQADFLIEFGYTLVGAIGTMLVSVNFGKFEVEKRQIRQNKRVLCLK